MPDERKGRLHFCCQNSRWMKGSRCAWRSKDSKPAACSLREFCMMKIVQRPEDEISKVSYNALGLRD